MKRFAIPVLALSALLTASLSWAADPPAADRKADKTGVVKANNDFALELYAKLRREKGNLFFSPYSISTALAMTYGGAKGQTAAEMAKTLHFTLEPQRLHPAFAELIRETNGYGMPREYQLSVANALWSQKDYPFDKAYLKLTRDNYGARPRAVDFIKDSEGARQAINAWVEKQTQDKIKELFKSGDLNSLTRLVLTNAIYFKGDWAQPFDNKRNKKEQDFLVMSGQKSKVTMMHHPKAKFKYLQLENFQALEMPYGEGELAMVVLLPSKIDGLAQFEELLTSAKLAAWLAKLQEREVEIEMPKFKMTAEFKLNGMLAEMGMPRAFQPGADFTGLTDQDKGLHLAMVVHKAYVDVNEEGTEAAAATGGAIAGFAAPAPAKFRANHPFVFLIHDTRNQSILFLGRLSEPQAK